MYRYELKYAIDYVNADAITAAILTHPASFSKAFPDRQVNNIYLDTLNFDCYFKVQSNNLNSNTALMEAVHAVRPSPSLLTPVLHNTYQRAYYLSSDEKFRVTIDTEQRFRIPFGVMTPLMTAQIPVILELKYAAEDAAHAREITNYMKFRQTKNSKYVTGVEALYL